jgi:multidrug resistance efflux pump
MPTPPTTATEEKQAEGLRVQYPGHTADALGLENRYYSYQLLHKLGSARVLTWTILAIIGVILVILFLPWQQNIQANGFVTALHPGERPQSVTNAVPGMIAEWYVDEGQYVRKGDPILRLTEIEDKFFDTLTLARMGQQVNAKRGAVMNIAQKILAQKAQLKATTEARELAFQKATNKLEQARLKVAVDSADYAAARLDYQIAQVRFQQFKNLFEQGLVSQRELESRQLKLQESQAKESQALNKLDVTRNELANARVELNAVLADYDAKIAKIRAEIDEASYGLNDARGSLAKLENERSNVALRVGQYIVRAPQDGKIIRAMKAGVGEIIAEGEPVVTIMPAQHTIAVELFVEALDVPLIDKGTPVRLQFDGWPALVFSGWPGASLGTFGGHVIMIEDAASSDGKYRMLVAPDSTDHPWPEQLRMGSGALGWTLLKTVPVWYEIWRQFNGFPPDLQHSIDQTGSLPIRIKPKGKDKNKKKDKKEE